MYSKQELWALIRKLRLEFNNSSLHAHMYADGEKYVLARGSKPYQAAWEYTRGPDLVPQSQGDYRPGRYRGEKTVEELDLLK